MWPPLSRRCLTALLVALVLSLPAARCVRFARISIDAPLDAEISVADPVAVEARVGLNHGEASIALRVDGVDLGAALGLVPPFLDASGAVAVGGDVVSVSAFSIYTPAQGPRRVEALLSGLPRGTVVLEVVGTNPETGLVGSDTASVQVVESLELAIDGWPAAGLPGGPAAGVAEGVLANAALGQPIAAPPIATLGGQSIRTGHVEAAEAQVANGGP